METTITVQGLRKNYKTLRAVDGISFEVYQGEIFGMVGPNGAGKTTTIECVEGLRRPDGGMSASSTLIRSATGGLCAR